MDDALTMRLVQRTRRGPRDPERLLDRELVKSAQLLAERFSADVGHHVVEEPADLAGVDEGEDVGVLE